MRRPPVAFGRTEVDGRDPLTIEGGLLDVLDVLGSAGFDAVVVGALATFAWGEPRTTRDADVAAHAGFADGDEIVELLDLLETLIEEVEEAREEHGVET